jgi:ubiquinol-cytochrome c reductase cytochrome c1 subunit
MKRLAVVLFFLPMLAFAAGGSNEYVVSAPINLKDKVSLQNGAKLFTNYCMGCHSLKYLRYERMSEDLGIPADLVMENLNFTSERIGDTMTNAMDPKEAEKWFGAPPPDLTLTARLRTSDWLYSYLVGFYEDDERPYGYNNHVFPSVGMPHVMAAMEQDLGEDKFKSEMADLTNFLTYAAEPTRLERESLGIKVLLFLFILFWPAYFLKREYWKDVH